MTKMTVRCGGSAESADKFRSFSFCNAWRRPAQFCSKKLTDRRSDREQSFNFADLTNQWRKLMTQNALKTFRFVRLALMAGVGFPFILASNAFAQLPAPAAPPPPPPPGAAAPSAEVERVIVTGSNIPTAEETGPNPVDTYRPQDIEKLGIRNATDLQEFIPQEAGGTVNLNIGNGGDGTVQFNLRGLLPKETLVLIDGKRVAYGSLAGAGFSGGPDINLIPFSMVDHVDILKDGASAVYGSDAIAGVVNFFLIHKFRGLEIGGTYGNSNLGASNEMGEWEAWIKAGTGDDKTDIVVIADFWERTGGVFSRDRDLTANAFYIPWGGLDGRDFVGSGTVKGRRLLPSMFFGPGGTPLPGVNTPLPHSPPNAALSPFYKTPSYPPFFFAVPNGPAFINPHPYRGP